MYAVIWAFRPQPGRELEFEQAYGPRGGWVSLFRQAPGYLGTDLLRPAGGSGQYLTIDRWQSQAAYEAFRASRPAEYQALDQACEPLTECEEHLGNYVLLESSPA